MNNLIKAAILEGRAILFLGAGASVGCTNTLNESPPLGGDLAAAMADKVGWTYNGEPLGTVYAAALKALGTTTMESFLTSQYRNVKPSPALNILARMPWARIYSTNIDDAMEQALSVNSQQHVKVRSRVDMIEDKAQLLQSVDYVYLNGSIRAPHFGYVFSPEEYGKASSEHPFWYEEVAVDFMQCTFLFIGTKLSEPAFFHHVERYRRKAGTASPQGYLLVPGASPIEVAGFETHGLEYLNVTLADFAQWLQEEFNPIPTPTAIAQNKIPELRSLLGEADRSKQEQLAELLAEVMPVNRQSLSTLGKLHSEGTINPFYKGYKATWRDIIDGIPAVLAQYANHHAQVLSKASSGARLFAIIGAAGSGKSTFVHWLALTLADAGERVYYLDKDAKELLAIARELSRSNVGKQTYIFVDRLDPFRGDLRATMEKVPNVVIIGAESQNVWRNRIAAEVASPATEVVPMSEIADTDVDAILNKLRLFGPWTRLSKMSDKNRRIELFSRSKRQLLIGLMEATTGIGFEEIITRDFGSIADYGDKTFFVVACIATMHRAELSQSAAARTLSNLGLSDAPAAFAARMDGLLVGTRNRISARHPIYARKIIESVVDRDIVFKAAAALLESFSVYPHPVVTSLDRNDAIIFKSVFNHRFLTNILRGDEGQIVAFYSRFEKIFETDGLFWLQYGLAMRSFRRHHKAFELLQTAYNAFPHDHTRHALAQQRLILAAMEDVPTPNARAHLADAIKLLEALDDVLQSDDTYPIVTLAEGHVRAMRRLDGTQSARVKAGEYVQTLVHRLKRGHEPRLDTARLKLFTFAATGVWKEDIDQI
ncbi:MAG: SIR2 family protein [Luteibacter sp.]